MRVNRPRKFNMSRAAIYARFSTDLQNERSIDDQLALCRAYAEREGLNVVATFDDRARSGGSVLGRDGLLHLMDKAREHEFDVLVVEAFAVKEPKTKQFVSLLADAAKDARKTLIVGSQFDEATYKAARNVQTSLLATASDVNTEQLLAFDKIIVTRDAVAQLAERLS